VAGVELDVMSDPARAVDAEPTFLERKERL